MPRVDRSGGARLFVPPEEFRRGVKRYFFGAASFAGSAAGAVGCTAGLYAARQVAMTAMPHDLVPRDLTVGTQACAEFIPCLARLP